MNEAKSKKDLKANRLLEETSPYLRQHAHNPVDWFAWGPEALEESRRQDKPIFLSVGYSACHWCHVMERESFESEAIANILNENFICIKVDREERPDIDQIYMNVVQMMTGHGGWPMSVFLNPDLKPIFAGTYFPPHDHYGMPGFPTVLKEVMRVYQEKPPQLQEQTEKIVAALKSLSDLKVQGEAYTNGQLEKAAQEILNHFDSQHGGFGGAPKFPQTMALRFLLQIYERTKDGMYLKPVTHSLKKMADGGIYDHLAGGFARYSVDERWAVPHFEKMLYDNALLSQLYFETFQVTQDEFFKKVGLGVLNWVQNEMLSPEGGFYSAQDADSEGEEGKFYVWDPEEIKSVLGDEVGQLVCKHLGVHEKGNFEKSKTVLFMAHEMPEKKEILKKAKSQLLDVREKRIPPATDDKILTAWNALMIRGFVRGYEVSRDPKLLKAATDCADYLLQVMKDPKNDARLRVTAKGHSAKLPAYLDDYAFFTAALFDLFEATGQSAWLKPAERFLKTLWDHFRDPKGSGFFFTADDHEKLIDRPKSFFDASIPSGNAVALECFFRARTILGDNAADEWVRKSLQDLTSLALTRPLGMTQILSLADVYLGPAIEVVVYEGEDDQFEAFLAATSQAFLPRSLRVFKSRANGDMFPKGLGDLLAGKDALAGQTTGYFCEAKTCSEPVTELKIWQKKLATKQFF